MISCFFSYPLFSYLLFLVCFSQPRTAGRLFYLLLPAEDGREKTRETEDRSTQLAVMER